MSKALVALLSTIPEIAPGGLELALLRQSFAVAGASSVGISSRNARLLEKAQGWDIVVHLLRLPSVCVAQADLFLRPAIPAGGLGLPRAETRCA